MVEKIVMIEDEEEGSYERVMFKHLYKEAGDSYIDVYVIIIHDIDEVSLVREEKGSGLSGREVVRRGWAG